MPLRPVEKILIVDDEPDIVRVIRLYLEESGYATSWAEDGESAIAMLDSGEYSLALLDIRMPKVGGVEVLRHVHESGSDTAIIMMTAHGSEDLAVECMKSGAVDYFPKPFDLTDMRQRVERAVTYRRTLLENKRLEREKEYFHSMMSHDMKNPMAAAIGSIDIIREERLGPVNDEQKEYLQSAIDSCNEVLAMINNLLDIQRFSAGRAQMKIQPNDPAEMISTAVGRFSRAAEYEEITLKLQLGDDLPYVAVDRNAFSRVMGNLLINAVKYTHEGGEITVSCGTLKKDDLLAKPAPSYVKTPDNFFDHPDFVRISVKDTGGGIPAEELGRIFEPFVQVEGGIGRGGAGLGLAFCMMAIECFGGMIWAESEGDTGSEFILVLPAIGAQIPNERT